MKYRHWDSTNRRLRVTAYPEGFEAEFIDKPHH